MDTREVIDKLSQLIHLDIDAVHAYGQAIKQIDLVPIRETLEQFLEDHDRHVRNLSDKIRQLGGDPPEYSRDFKGFLIEGFTAIRSMTGNKGALEAMKMNERLTNRKYNDAMGWDVPLDVKTIIQSNFEDEKRHLQFIEQALDKRLWEQGKVQKKRERHPPGP